MTSNKKKLSASAKKKTCMYKMMFYCADIMAKLHNILVIALVIKRRTHKAHITDRGAENPTGPKLPDFIINSAIFFFC